VQVDIEQQTAERLHVKFTDPTTNRWEVPTNISPVPSPPSTPPSNPLYEFVVPKAGDAFSLTIIRRSDKSVIFNSSQLAGTLRFVDQYLSIGTTLPSNYSIYGIGEHVLDSFKLSNPLTLTLFNSDNATPVLLNLYGSHPFYLEMRPSGLAHGVFLRNSNGMDVLLDSNILLYRTIRRGPGFLLLPGPPP
jgi:alpha-glucosidase